MAPRSGMQVHTQAVIPEKPRMFLIDLGSLELSSRAKGKEEMCGGGSAFPCECGATPYSLAGTSVLRADLEFSRCISERVPFT